MIRFLDNDTDAYGTGVSIGGGGTTILGGGESAITMEDTLTADGQEVLFLCNDSQIDFYTNCQNGASSATHTYIDTNGNFSGNASGASLLLNYGGRIASPSKMIADGKMRLYLSTSSMTTDKPPTADGHILHFAWDNTGGYDNELAISNAGTGKAGAHLAVRCGAGSGSGNTQSWSDWYTVLDTGNYYSKVPRSYGFVKFATSGAVSVASSGTTISKTISLTTHGRPVFLAVSGDNNPTDSSSWFNIYFFRSGTQLSHQIDESHGASWNIPFCMVYLDIVSAGTYTYECRITSGSGATNLNEDSGRQSPNFVAFEI